MPCKYNEQYNTDCITIFSLASHIGDVEVNLLNSQFAQCCGSGGGGSEAREEDQDGDRKEVTSSAFAIRIRGVTSLCPAARLYILSMRESMSCRVQQPVEPYWHIYIYIDI